jgi:hypothetical protein
MNRILPFLLCAALAGCVPIRAYDTPTVEIEVRDASTHAALAGARVTDLDGKPPPTALTDVSGAAVLAPVTYWTVIAINLDPAQISNALRISANGYRTRNVVICFTPIRNEPVVRLTVLLEAGSGEDPADADEPCARRDGL